MKNLTVIPGILALILTGVLFYMISHQHPEQATVKQPAAAAGVSGNGFRIAYFDLDSVEAHYDYFKDVIKRIKVKEGQMNEELSGMEKGYQQKIAQWQKKGNSMSQEEGQQAQQEYAVMQQNYQAKKQSLQEALFKHNEDLKSDIRKNIQDFLGDYNKQKNFSYIFADESNSFMYAKDTAYNITNDLISGLNAIYRKK